MRTVVVGGVAGGMSAAARLRRLDVRVGTEAVALDTDARTLTVHDLIDLDLAYSPPFGAAKDRASLAGLLASNVLDGTMPVWHASDLDDVLVR